MSTQVWWHSIFWFKKYRTYKNLSGRGRRRKSNSPRPSVTLKMESKSPKPNELFGLSNWYVHANLIKLHLLVQEIWLIQSVTPTPMPMPGIRTETNMSSLTFGVCVGGDIIFKYLSNSTYRKYLPSETITTINNFYLNVSDFNHVFIL